MIGEELRELVADIRQLRSELTEVEVKSAQGGTPRSARATLSAFANRPGGGILLFGMNEAGGFEVVGVGDAARLQEEISGFARSDLEPALQPEFTVEEIDGKTIVAVEVPEIPATQKPCYIRARGLPGGAYIRVGTTNRQLTDYEVFGYLSAREQPRFDEETIPGATLDDLDRSKIDAYFVRLRQARPRAGFLGEPVEQTLVQLGIAGRDLAGVVRPTLSGLLVFGNYPQQFEPQLVITCLQYFGITEEERAPSGARFLDNQKFEGTIPELVEETVNRILANIRKSSLIDGLFRRDIPEYPEEAIREAVVNAVAHRDYSPYVRGSYVQIRLFADRLEVQSPGGLFGNVTEESLDQEQSTRNRVLIRLLEDLHLVENRGSGIRTMIGAMRGANLEPPRFQDRRSSFWVVLRNHTLMTADTIAWLNQFAALPLTDPQRIALAYLRHNDQISNSDYRRLNHVDALTATRDLRGLVQSGLTLQHGAKRGTYYSLAISATLGPSSLPKLVEEQLLAYVREHGSIDNARARHLLGVDTEQARRLLTKLLRRGLLRREGQRRWAVYYLP